MKSRKASLHRIPFYIASILFLALIFCLTTQVLADITVSGTAYDSEGGSGLDSKTIVLRVDGGNADSVSTSSGVYQFTNVTVSAGSTITVWIDGDPTYKGTTVTIANDGTSNITGLDIYGSTIIVRSEKAGTAITNADLADYFSDSDIHFSVSGGNLTVDSDHELHVWTGDSFSPGGAVTTSSGGSPPGGDIHIDDNATFSAGGTISCGGSWTADTGTTFTHNSNTVTFDADDAGNTITSGGSDFYNLYFNDTSGSGYTISTPDSTNDVGQHTSVVLDSNGYPVVVYHDATGYNLKVMHCNDANCNGGNESIESPDTTGDVGKYASLALDSNGYPVVAYYDATGYNLKVMHCNDANCNGGNESIESPDTTGDVGKYASLALDSNGYPVISYYDDTNDDLKVMHCNDANCSGGGESIETVDSAADQTGKYTSIALDSSGYPVVSYHRHYEPSTDILTYIYVLHCNDANCSGGDESIEQVASALLQGEGGGYEVIYTSLALDSSGYPVVAYGYFGDYFSPDSSLEIVHCDDANCSGGGETTSTVDSESIDGVHYYPSIALDSSGYPVISYCNGTTYLGTGDFKIARCNDANCSGGDESIEAVDTSGNVGRYSSIALNSQDKVMVSYYDTSNGNLKLYTWQGTSAAWILQDDVTTANDFTISAGAVTAPGAGTQSDIGRGIAVDSSGNSYVVGSQANDIVILKYDSNGDLDTTWGDNDSGKIVYDSGGNDNGRGIAIDSGNCYVVGSQGNDIVVLKYDSNGDLDTTWGDSDSGKVTHDYPYGCGIAVDSSGNCYVVGDQGGYYDPASNIVVLKYNSDGDPDTTWGGGDGILTYTYGAGAGAGGIDIDSSGNCYVTGHYYSGTVEDEETEILTRKINSTGTGFSWTSIYGTGVWLESEFGRGIAVDSSNNCYVVGDQPGASWTSDIVVLKYNSSGALDTTWGDADSGKIVYNSGGTQNDFGRGVAIDSGNCYVVGYQPGNGQDIVALKYDSNGDLDTTWGDSDSGKIVYNSAGTQNDYGYGIAVDSGNSYITGYQSTNGNDILTLKYDSAGDLDVAGFGSGGVVTYNSGAQGILTVSGNWSNSDTFTHNSGTVTFNGTGAQQITTGGSNWNAIEITNADGSVTFTDEFTCATFTDTTAGSTLNFPSGQTATITASGGLTLTGASGAGNLITLRRYGGSGTDQWNINPSGGSWSVSYVDVKDSNNLDATVIDPSNSTDSGNNTKWFQKAYVDKASSNPVYPYVSWGDAASNIQDGINAASAEDAETVIVRAGTYDENITMTDGVNVVSETTVEPLIVGDGTDYVVTFDGAFTTGCTLDGFDISGGGTYPGIYVHATGNEINNSTIITNCLIHDNTSGPGIRLVGSDATTAPTIDDNEIYSNGEEGIDILDAGSASEDAVIVNNIIHDNTLAGIYIEGTSYATIGDNNAIYSNGGAGITTGGTGYELLSGSSVTIKGNTVGGSGQGNGGAGIYLKGSGTSIQVTIGGSIAADSNTIFYNTAEGISLEDIDQASIENNGISYNSEDGILLVDVSTVNPHIKNNSIYQHTTEAGINIQGASNVTIGDNNDISNNYAGIAFDTNNTNSSSQPVTIKGNLIHDNFYAGISVIDAITGKVTISGQNDIYLNDRGGISIQNSCELDIIENKIRDNVRGGIHTGTDQANGGGFSGSVGSAVLAIKKNKVYDNGASSPSIHGGGIDVRHASGTIYNNLVYDNYRGGIRFGNYITEIIHNTVADNGQSGLGGGIIYDDLAGAVSAEPEGTLTDSPNFPPDPLIRNNISAFNVKTGLRVGKNPSGLTSCPGNPDRDNPNLGDKYRDYNLLYSNNGTGATDCGWYRDSGISYVQILSCANKQYGGCGADWPSPFAMEDPNDIIADPLFVDAVYHLDNNSPAKTGGAGGVEMGAYGGSDPITW